MAAGGFAKYMSAISASTALVKIATRPLSHVSNPYVLLAITYIAGQLLNIVIPSAAGLAMLLLVAMYPTLVKLGIRPVAAEAVIGTTACLDLGPASPASNVAAEVVGISPIEYFALYQAKVAAVVIPVVAALHFFWQRWCDRREGDGLEADAAIEAARAGEPLSVAYQGNVVDLLEYLDTNGIAVDLYSDQTSCHVPYDGGYTPAGVSFDEGRELLASSGLDIIAADDLTDAAKKAVAAAA